MLVHEDAHLVDAKRFLPRGGNLLRGFGLALRHGTDAIKRSVIEGVALNTRWAWAKVATERGARDGARRRGGGAVRGKTGQHGTSSGGPRRGVGPCPVPTGVAIVLNRPRVSRTGPAGPSPPPGGGGQLSRGKPLPGSMG